MGQEITKISNQPQQLTITKENWQQGWALIPVAANSTPTEILSMNTPHLSQLGKSPTGHTIGVVVYQAQISSLNGFMGLGWTKMQMDECGEIAYQEYPWITIAELKQFFLKIKAGYYKSNKNISPAIFLEFLAEYAAGMMYERGEFYGRKKNRSRILSIYHLEGKALKVATWMCSEIAKCNIGESYMQKIQELTNKLSNREVEQEVKNRQDKFDKYQQRMKELAYMNSEKVRALVSQGYTLDQAISKILNDAA